MTEPKKTPAFIRSVGRRKTAAARVRLMPGTGTLTVNAKDYTKYFPLKGMQATVLSPLVAVGKEKQFDVSVKVAGGGPQGQMIAIRHGIARALIAWNPDLRPLLKSESLLTRDPRAKERKKFGLRRARRAHQWRKR